MKTSPKPCHSYIFFDIEPSVRNVSKTQLEKDKKAFEKYAEKRAKDAGLVLHAYATLGFKAGTRFMIHINAATPEEIQFFVRDLLHTNLGAHLKVTCTLFGMTRESPYKPKHVAESAAKIQAEPDPEPAAADQPHRYLVVYPFTKTIEWHLLPMEQRREVMKAHVGVGRKWSGTVSQLLLYAYGIDDHEFIVSYYTDKIEDFQSLVMDMRATESRRHTKNDLPIFTCIHMPLGEALSMI